MWDRAQAGRQTSKPPQDRPPVLGRPADCRYGDTEYFRHVPAQPSRIQNTCLQPIAEAVSSLRLDEVLGVFPVPARQGHGLTAGNVKGNIQPPQLRGQACHSSPGVMLCSELSVPCGLAGYQLRLSTTPIRTTRRKNEPGPWPSIPSMGKVHRCNCGPSISTARALLWHAVLLSGAQTTWNWRQVREHDGPVMRPNDYRQDL